VIAEAELLTPADVARRLNVSIRTVRRAIVRDDELRLPAVDVTPASAIRTWRIHPDELADWLEQRRNHRPRPERALDIPLPAAPRRSRLHPRSPGTVAVTPEMGR
jgi:hypothetical protein